MHYLKKNTKLSILAFLILILCITISISTLAKTEIYYPLYDNPKILSTTSPKPEVQKININTTSQYELTSILQISEPLAWKIIAFPFTSFPRTRESIILSEELEGFKDPEDLLQFTEITNLEWQEWEEQGIIITVK